MKKITSAAVFILLLLLVQLPKAEVSFGAKVGFNTTSQDFKFSQFGDLGSINKTGAEFGFFLQFPLVSALSVTTEVRYFQKGEQFDYFTWGSNSVNPDPSLTGRLSYVSLMAIGKLSIPLGGFNIYGMAGPRFDFKTGPKEVVGYELYTNSYQSPAPGGLIGAGAEFKLSGIGWLLVEGYYDFDWKETFDSGDLQIDTQRFGILVGIRT